MHLPVADPKRRSVFQAGSGQQQGPRISCTWRLKLPQAQAEPITQQTSTQGSRAFEAASPELVLWPALPQGLRLLFPPPSSQMFLSSCSAPFAQLPVTPAPRASSTLLCQSHKARTQFFGVYQQVPCGRARQTHTLCNTTNHCKCSAVQLQQSCGTSVEPKPVLTPDRASGEQGNAKKELGNF